MRIKRSEPGLIVSSAAHVALLAATLVAFSSARKFDDAQEAVPVEMITESAFNQIAKGEKSAREAKPVQRAEKLAETPELKPHPPLAEARKDVPLPPPPFRRMPDPGEAEPKPPEPVRQAALPSPAEAEKVAPEPPPRPKTPKEEPPKVEPHKAEAPKPEAAKPAPPPRPQPEKKAEPEPEKAEPVEPPKPVARPRDVMKEPHKEAAKEPPKPVEKPKEIAKSVEKPVEKPAPEKPRLKPDDVAALLARSKTDAPAAARPKSGDETSETKTKFDASAISRMLDKDKPQATASAGREVVRTASLGAPNASAQKMAPNMMAALDSLMMEQYKGCWRYFGAATGRKYVPAVRVRFNPDGSFAAEPSLLNPTSDPALASLAESAMRAVRACNPLRIPAQFAPYYNQWKSRAIAFDPEEMS